MVIDAHIHRERGPCGPAWIRRFVAQAQAMGLGRIHLLEHSPLLPGVLAGLRARRDRDPAIDG